MDKIKKLTLLNNYLNKLKEARDADDLSILHIAVNYRREQLCNYLVNNLDFGK